MVWWRFRSSGSRLVELDRMIIRARPAAMRWSEADGRNSSWTTVAASRIARPDRAFRRPSRRKENHVRLEKKSFSSPDEVRPIAAWVRSPAHVGRPALHAPGLGRRRRIATDAT